MQNVHRRAAALVALAASVAIAAGCGSGGDDGDGGSGGGTSVFVSSQGSELTEAQALRSEVLTGSPESVKFIPVKDDPYVIDRITAESQSGKGTTDLVGALHGGFVSMEPDDLLLDVSDVAEELADAGIPRQLLELGKLGTDTQHYIPWMQATYVMVANKKALPYLPAGADVEQTHVRAAARVGAARSRRERDRRGSACRPGRQRPHPALLPGLPDPLLQRRRRDDVQEPRGGPGLGVHAAAVAAREPQSL